MRAAQTGQRVPSHLLCEIGNSIHASPFAASLHPIRRAEPMSIGCALSCYIDKRMHSEPRV
jgi:hypothetical protein